MPTKIEKDAATGTETTGHEWDGIKELNTPLPSWWVWVFIATIVWSLVYVVLYPAIPLGETATQGVLGYDSREEVATVMADLAAERAPYVERISELSHDEIVADPDLANFALRGGEAAFADNCAPCHAPGGAGRPGYPALADDAWLWGGTHDAIEQTIRYGVRSGHDEERYSEMPAFTDVIEKHEREAVTHFVASLSGTIDHDAELAAEGAPVFADNCASCHGDGGEGGREFGAPRLNDAVWLYGGSLDLIARQIAQPQHGVMPAWQGRLDDATIKMLAIYVHTLGGGELTETGALQQ